MSYRNVLVPVTRADTSHSALLLAIAFAERFGAHVEALHVRPDPRAMIPYVGEGMSGALIEEVMGAAEKDAADRAITTHRYFHETVAARGLTLASVPQGVPGATAEWREESGREELVVAAAGRVADVVVVPRPFQDPELGATALFETVLFDTGQALLVAPPQPVEDMGRRVLIAWNGSPEAARAVSCALPFIAKAEAVRAVSVTGWAEGPASVHNLVRRLAWHDVHAEVETLHDGGRGAIGDTVLAEARRFEADVIVMGAYTQSRLRQMILGGVTRHVLSNATLPLFMAH